PILQKTEKYPLSVSYLLDLIRLFLPQIKRRLPYGHPSGLQMQFERRKNPLRLVDFLAATRQSHHIQTGRQNLNLGELIEITLVRLNLNLKHVMKLQQVLQSQKLKKRNQLLLELYSPIVFQQTDSPSPPMI